VGKVLALANQKGGVGKTTTAVNLACDLAARGYRILLIDLDPQGNATSSVGLDKRELEYTVYDVLVDGTEVDSAVIQDARPSLDILGANHLLAGAEVELTSLARPQMRLDAALQSARARYDVIIIDCPPSLGLLTINGLVAADDLVIPVQCEYLALEGLTQLINTVDLVKRGLNRRLDILGLVMTMYDSRTRLAGEVVRDVARLFPNRIFRSIVPRTVRLAEAPSHGRSIAEYDPSSRGAQAYRDLADEVIQRVGLPPAGSEVGATAAETPVAAQSE